MQRADPELARWLRKIILAHLSEAHTGVKPSALRRASQRIGNAILSNWLTCWDPVHLGGMKATMALEAAARRSLGPLVDLACEQLFHGHVLPVQRVLVLIDEARSAALGKCVCRAAGVTNDLLRPEPDDLQDCTDRVPARLSTNTASRRRPGSVYLIGSSQEAATRLAAILDAYQKVEQIPGERETTSPRLRAILEQIRQQDHLTPEQRLGLLWKETYPFWEVLLAHDAFTSRWSRNMAQHRKAWPIHKEILKPLVLAQYHTRGALFTGMEVVDEPYAICTCPGPENDQGCSLVNWYYFSRLDHALFPNETDFFGQARDNSGAVLPCQRFPERGSRPCLGCGCKHRQAAG
ncbi:MAG: hypothetical protein JW797_08630 [Bradymonadales bacterium]|nr:hypothetical protein [Bradymonadales bacterium]